MASCLVARRRLGQLGNGHEAELIRKMLCAFPRERITAEQALKASWCGRDGGEASGLAFGFRGRAVCADLT
jgi:hypothetical protein